MAAHDNEVYLVCTLSPNPSTITGFTGGGGAAWNYANGADQPNAHSFILDDFNAAGHLATDLPSLDYTTSGVPPADTSAIIFALGDGSTTPTVRHLPEADGNGINPVASLTYFGPSIGDALVYVLVTEGVIGATPASYTLLGTGSSGIANWAAYMKDPSTGDGSGGTQPDDRVDFAVPITGAVHWILLGWDIADPGAPPYILDDGPMSVVGTDLVFTATEHGPGGGPALASTGGILLGSAELSATSPGSLASEGGIIGGTASLESTGGSAELASTGGVVQGRARITSLAPWPPPPPVPQTRRLGCGVYDVFIFDRGLRRIVGRTPFTTLNWNRVLDDTSDATVTVDGVSNTGALRSCCQLLGGLNPWQHEIGIYRTGRRVWSGPVLTVQFPAEQVLIHALDLSGWLTIREIIHTRNDVGVDLAAIWVAYVSDAMSVENTAGLYAHPALDTGVTADRLYTEDMHSIASDAIAELARTGLDWTCIDRVMSGGPTLAQPPAFPGATPIPTLIDESFALAPTVTRDGSIMGNAWRSLGMAVPPSTTPLMGEYGPAYPATVDHIAQDAAPDYAALEAQFGRIDRVVNETKILDQASINQNAATRYDLTKRPVDVIDSGKLLPSAGITIDQLTPGSLQNLHLSRACVQIAAVYRLKSLSVTAASDGSEEVDGAWEPVGSVEAHEDLG